MAGVAPRVDAAMLKPGLTVRYVGKVSNVDGKSAELEAPNQKPVRVFTENFDTFRKDQFVECIGKVNDDGSLTDQVSFPLCDTFDLGLYYEMVKVTSKFSNVF